MRYMSHSVCQKDVMWGGFQEAGAVPLGGEGAGFGGGPFPLSPTPDRYLQQAVLSKHVLDYHLHPPQLGYQR